MSSNIFGTRLKLARKMAGMSLQELSEALGNVVTKQALSKYEKGQMKPNSNILVLLANVLEIKPDYLVKSNPVELGSISFRKKKSLSKKDEESIVEKARDYAERYIEIHKIMGQEKDFVNPISQLDINTWEDVENAANHLREYWKLGNNPISNIVELLESHGIVVLLIAEVDKIDGLAVMTAGNVPIVVINISDKSIERIRFTIIHELAHLILKLSEEVKSDHRLMEEMCHFFSSCFLIPSEEVIQQVGGRSRTYIELSELVSVKERYGISIRAFLHRLKKMGIISNIYYDKWMVWTTKNYGPKSEPGKYLGKEAAVRLKQLVSRALSEELISFSKAAELLNISINEIRKDFESVK